MKKIGIYSIVCLLLVMSILPWMVREIETEAANIVIVLDAGHDDTHTGASGNGLREENLNLQIALACKNELETYEGVTVYMIRDSGACPYGGRDVIGSSTDCNLQRTKFAQSVGANAYISIHNNSSTNTSARGASVYYPTTNYNSTCGVVGEGLAQAVLTQLLSIGLENRGVSVRYSEDNTRYPDGSLADYYGVIKNSKKRGVPAIIIEHAFISNSSDAAQYLSTYEKLWQLGQLDATAIAGYYGLTKKAVLDYSKASVTASTTDHAVYHLQAANVIGANSLMFAVWSENGGFDDLKYYNASKDYYGNWVVDIPIGNHKTDGIYKVDAYVNQDIGIGGTSFEVEGPSVKSVKVVNADHDQGTFDVKLYDVKSGTGIASVTAAVWPKQNYKKLKWITPTKTATGSYSLSVNMSDYGYLYGDYHVDIYVTDTNNITKCVSSQEYNLSAPEMNLSVAGSSASTVFEITAFNLPYGTNLSNLKFCVWINDSDMTQIPIVYTPEENELHQWSVSVYPAELKQAGIYKIQAWGTLPDGQTIILAEQEYQVVKDVYTIDSTVNDKNQRVWSWTEIEAVSSTTEDYQLKINPWCDYIAVREALDETKVACKDFVAYELKQLPIVSDSAVASVTDAAVNIVTDTAVNIVTDTAVSAEAVETITFKVPEFIQDRKIQVLVSTQEALTFVPLEMYASEDGSMITVEAAADGCFVIAAEEPTILGDVDLDRAITLEDAQITLRAVMKMDSVSKKVNKYGDLNRDGKLNLADVSLILKRVFGI